MCAYIHAPFAPMYFLFTNEPITSRYLYLYEIRECDRYRDRYRD